MTTSELILLLRDSRDNLKSNLLGFDVPVAQITKINTLIGMMNQIETGIGYMCATFVANKTQTITISGIQFIPHSFAVSSLYAIEHDYSVTTPTFKVIGAISIDELELGTHTHTINMLANEMDLESIQITTSLTQNVNETCTLVVTLPETYYFLGENEYAMLGNTHEEV